MKLKLKNNKPKLNYESALVMSGSEKKIADFSGFWLTRPSDRWVSCRAPHQFSLQIIFSFSELNIQKNHKNANNFESRWIN